MRTINMTPGNDRDIIWLVKISRGADEYKFSTAEDRITLSSNLWDGKVLAINDNRFSVNEIGKRINIPAGGTIGEISTITFSLSNKQANTFVNDFINEFYPATSGEILVAMDVEVGIVWTGATAESDITWLYKYNVEEYAYDDQRIDLVCSEFSDFEYFNLPYYKVQAEFDNGMSYFPDASEDAIEKNIPIVYGRPDNFQLRPYAWGSTPTVKVSKSKYVIASHECYNSYSGTTETVNKYLFEEIAEY